VVKLNTSEQRMERVKYVVREKGETAGQNKNFAGFRMDLAAPRVLPCIIALFGGCHRR
jgi:hypothetical protein